MGMLSPDSQSTLSVDNFPQTALSNYNTLTRNSYNSFYNTERTIIRGGVIHADSQANLEGLKLYKISPGKWRKNENARML